MKKTLFLLMALVASMSINAQTGKVMKVLDGETVLFTQDVKSTIKVVFDDAPPAPTTGTATRRNGDDAPIEVKWIQLWAGGPKFAEYNVGANSAATEYGGYYCWGSSIDKDPNSAYKSGTDPLTGTDDTATNLWGSKWRMPTEEELQALIDNCDVTWTDSYKGTGIKGRLFTGQNDYSENSIFLPAAGCCDDGSVYDQGDYGNYWSSTPYDSNSNFAYSLDFYPGYQEKNIDGRNNGYSVRAVLK